MDQAHWRRVADELSDFVAAHHRWPRADAVDVRERCLGSWLTNQRSQMRRGAPWMTPERVSTLDALLPGWAGRPRSELVEERDAAWSAQLDQLGEFLRRERRWPSRSAPEPDERRLAVFRERQRRDAEIGLRCMTDERRSRLDAVAPGWTTSRVTGAAADPRMPTAERRALFLAALEYGVHPLVRHRLDG